MTIDGVAHIVRSGIVAVVPENVRHSVKALTDGKAIIVDYPARRDFSQNEHGLPSEGLTLHQTLPGTSREFEVRGVWLKMRVTLRTVSTSRVARYFFAGGLGGITPRVSAFRGPGYPILWIAMLKEKVGLQFTQQRLIARLTSFGVLSLILTPIGLYQVIAYNAEPSGNGVGVRIALGLLAAMLASWS